MKRKLTVPILYAVLLLTGAVAGYSCDSEEQYPAGDVPGVLYRTSPMEVDLNLGGHPPLIAVVQSETGLKSVRMYLLKTGDAEIPWESEVTSFFNINSYSICLNLVYAEDMTGFKIVAVDLAGQTAVSILPFSITPLRNPPLVAFNGGMEELDYREGAAMPEIVVRMSSEERLQYLVLSEVVNRVEAKIQIYGSDTLHFTGGEQAFSFSLSDDAFQLKPGTTALKATVAAGAAGNPKVRVGTLYINYTVIPPPVVAFDSDAETMAVDEFQPLALTGRITAESGLSSVAYYSQTASGLTPIGSGQIFDPAVDAFDFSVVLERVTAGVTAIVVEATDVTGKQTRTAKGVSVNELFAPPVVSLDVPDSFFNGLVKNSQVAVTGNVSSDAGLTALAFTTVLKDGTETTVQETIADASRTNFPLSRTLTAAVDLAAIRITATDANGKEISRFIDVHVGYRYYRILASMDGSPSHADSEPGCFLSAAGRVYGYCEAMENVDKIDVNFSSYTTNTAVCISTLVSDTKFRHPTCGLDKWTGIRKLKIRTANTIKRSTFDRCTIDDILAQAAPTSDANRIELTTGNFETPTENVALYVTPIGGADKRVIVCYDRFELRTPNAAASQFWVKVKVEI